MLGEDMKDGGHEAKVNVQALNNIENSFLLVPSSFFIMCDRSCPART
jgi:hypothetical protein